MNKTITILLLALVSIVLGACRDDDEQTRVKRTLQEALDHLQRGDVETYMHYTDFGCRLDSTQQLYFGMAIRQKLCVQTQTGQDVVSSVVTKAKMHSDTIATVYYTQHFANGDSVLCSQKMVRTQGTWRLRMRE